MNDERDQKLTDENGIKKGRWRQDDHGAYQYVGVCPFNKALCRLRNSIGRRRREATGVSDDSR